MSEQPGVYLVLQTLFKTMGVFDSRVKFIFHTPYCVK